MTVQPSRSDPGDPVLIPFPFPRGLGSPGLPRLEAGPEAGLQAVTGGGLVAILDPTRGLRSVWRGGVQVSGALRLQWGSRLLHPAAAMTVGPGSWERRIPLPGRGHLVERGTLPDSAPAVLIHWDLVLSDGDGSEETKDKGTVEDEGDTRMLVVEVQPPGGRPHRSVSVGLSRTDGAAARKTPARGGLEESGRLEAPVGGGVAILEPSTDIASLETLLSPPEARQRARALRVLPRDGEERRILHVRIAEAADGPVQDALGPTLLYLEGAPLAMNAGSVPEGPFLSGIQWARPRMATGGRLAEIGLGGLQAGLPELAWGAFRALLAEEPPPPLPLLHLAAELATWTGELAELQRSRSPLMEVCRAMARERDPARDAPAAFPPPARVLERLAEGVEPLGRGWREEILELKERRISDGTPERMRLPVVGASAAPTPAGDQSRTPETHTDRPRGEGRPSLPRPEDFAPAGAPGLTGHRTLHAARLIRSWVEGKLGMTADAAYGRVTLAPRLLEGPALLSISGLRVGDAWIRFDYRFFGRTCSFALAQQGGRTPLNLVLEPCVPLKGPLRVQVNGEEADVPFREVEGGISLGLQFPLDPKREIVIQHEE